MTRSSRSSAKPDDAAASKPDQAGSSVPATNPPPTQATILLVDDDRAVRESLKRALSLEGWTIISAASGADALEQLDKGQPDVLITDLMMGCISGWDLLFHENMQRPDLPIFVITALPPEVTGGADRFAAEFFQKPIDLDALVAAIRRRLGAGSNPV